MVLASTVLLLKFTFSKTRSGLFMSVTITQSVPVENPLEVAVRFTCLLPSVILSFTVVTGTSAKSAPAGISTEEGTVASPGFEEFRLTSNEDPFGVFLVILSKAALA